MDNKYYVLTAKDRRILDDLQREQSIAPPPAMLPNSSKNYVAAPDVYWALPPCETGLPAATRNSDGSITPGVAICCLFKYDGDSDRVVPILNPVGLPFHIVVRNHYTRVANDYVQVWRHKNGAWTNERPELVVDSQATTTTTSVPGAVTAAPACQGECIWIAKPVGSGYGWGEPTGGCSNVTTTTTTSTTTTTTTTSTTTGTTTTTTTTTRPPNPCEANVCRLRCVAVPATTTTTAGPGTSTTTAWPPAPATGYSYQVIGTACNSPCNCFGAGDPCYLLDGEIESKCVYVTTTTAGPTTSTTTPGPIAGPQTCDIANTQLGAPTAGSYRAATLKSFPEGWVVCQDCPSGEFPLYPRGSKDLIDSSPSSQVIVHDSPCGRDPCSLNNTAYTSGKAIYRAFSLQDQYWYWGSKEGSDDIINSTETKFLANWIICQACGPGLRPAVPPPAWLFFDSGNPSSVSISTADGMYIYETSCIAGSACATCEMSHVGDVEDSVPPITTSTTTASPTPRPTTTRPPCGCAPPPYCPTISGECSRTECGPGLAGTTPVCPVSTTSGPNQCWDGTKICSCNTTTGTTGTTTTAIPNCGNPTTTLPPCGQCTFLASQIGFGQIGWVQTEFCNSGCFCSPPAGPASICGGTATSPCVRPTPPETTAPPPCVCTGACGWYSISLGGGNYGWALGYNTCLSNWCACNCSSPNSTPGNICQQTETPCVTPPTLPPATTTCYPGQPPASTTPNPGCECCTTQACEKYCIFKGNASGSWTKIEDPCPTTCPCPQYPTSRSESDCDFRRYRCGTVLPTTPPPTTTTGTTGTTTTTPAPGACCAGGVCSVISFRACQLAGGVFQGGGTNCTGVVCTTTTTTTANPVGICCVGNAGTGTGSTCIGNTLKSYCDYLNGQFIAGITCATAGAHLCAPTTTTTSSPTGRCCYGANSCATNTKSQCDALSGVWTSGLDCFSNPCTGRCCSISGYDEIDGILVPRWACVSGQTQAWCNNASGAWTMNTACTDMYPFGCAGTTTTTTTTTTAAPLGRCCIAGVCSQKTQAQCASSGGTDWVANASCTGFMCPEV